MAKAVARNQRLTKRWFERRHHDYQVHIVDAQQGLYAVVGPVLSRYVHGRALVIGSGPMLNFAVQDGAAPFTVCLDLAVAPLARLAHSQWAGAVTPLCADATALPFAPGSFDTVVLPFVLHHVAQDSVQGTLMAVQRILEQAAGVLRPGGRVVVLDLFLDGPLQNLQRLVYAPLRLGLNLLGQPMMFFQSTTTLPTGSLIYQEGEPVPLPRRIVPTLLLPRWQVDSRWHPARIHCLSFQAPA